MTTIKIGSRGSRLALLQAELIRDELRGHFPEFTYEIIAIKTTGDRILDAPLSKIGDKGLFTREIEEELLRGGIDLAVHSMKDVPTALPDGLRIAAITRRLDPRDVFISRDGRALSDLGSGSTIATSSLRRRAQVLAFRPGLNIVDIRGNLQTRLQKLRDNTVLDGIILARAGVERLGMIEIISEVIPAEVMIPACGQACLAVETAQGSTRVNEMLSLINHEPSARAVSCERAFMAALEGGCQVPIAASAVIDGESISVSGMVASLDGSVMFRDRVTAPADHFIEAGLDLARRLLDAGAGDILREVYGHTLQNEFSGGHPHE